MSFRLRACDSSGVRSVRGGGLLVRYINSLYSRGCGAKPYGSCLLLDMNRESPVPLLAGEGGAITALLAIGQDKTLYSGGHEGLICALADAPTGAQLPAKAGHTYQVSGLAVPGIRHAHLCLRWWAQVEAQLKEAEKNLHDIPARTASQPTAAMTNTYFLPSLILLRGMRPGPATQIRRLQKEFYGEAPEFWKGICGDVGGGRTSIPSALRGLFPLIN
ncbi:hypothetical protein BDK51DRAFT_43042 [Blyttiomyces helicus]|uniref:Uncharacterized protein n=1 Tax=Blyttiomyces helicus TaxID=388810 RepID=A0A4P9W625_9FUNG|nr:hypothetical protein BDK51DRAFT_43042 [Blyttiomyces helicus]|eukprot:RKO87744.1 hypothetical protein BDK51DRAFT_43042 [Blyttiomyces helicus]